MTPDQAVGAVQFIADQQGQFATEILRMQNRLEQNDSVLRRLEASVGQLTGAWRQANGDLQRIAAVLQELVAAQQRAQAELAALRTTVAGLGRHAA